MTLPLQSPGSKYAILAELGSGGMAVVYLAVLRGQNDFRKLVVLKVLHPFLADNPSDREVFLREARLAARLNHPNVVQTYEVVEDEGRPMLVMEYLEGKAFNFIQHEAWSMPRALALSLELRVIADALAGLHYAHELCDFDGTELRIVHRDVSPHNIFVTFDGQTKVLDFGIAKLANSPHDTEVGVRKGKPRYMAREQALGEALDRRCDVFAMGVVLWEAIARRRLWGRRSDFEIVRALSKSEPIQSPRAYDANLSPELESICMRALEHDRDKRYRDCQEFRADLLNFMSGLTPEISTQEVGQVLAEKFAEFREQQKQLIAKHLAQAPGETPALASSPRHSRPAEPGRTPASHPVRVSARSEAAQHTSSLGTYSVRTPGLLSKTSSKIGLTMAVAASLSIAGVWLLRSANQDGPVAPSSEVLPSASAVATASASAQEPQHVALTISALPKHARLFLDGRLLAENPARSELPRDGSTREVRAEADGYSPKTKQVTLDRSRTIEFNLARVAPEPPAPSGPNQRRLAKPPKLERPEQPLSAGGSSARPSAPEPEPRTKPRRPLDTDNPWASETE